jgi:hypothetical protein
MTCPYIECLEEHENGDEKRAAAAQEGEEESDEDLGPMPATGEEVIMDPFYADSSGLAVWDSFANKQLRFSPKIATLNATVANWLMTMGVRPGFWKKSDLT